MTIFLALATILADVAVGAAAYAMAISNKKALAMMVAQHELLTTLVKQHDERLDLLEAR